MGIDEFSEADVQYFARPKLDREREDPLKIAMPKGEIEALVRETCETYVHAYLP